MLTLTENPAELDPRERRFTALVGIAAGLTGDELRALSAREDHDERLAAEIDLLAWCGFTTQAARAVLAERDMANGGGRKRRPGVGDARREIRALALLALEQHGPAAIGMFRQVAAMCGEEGDLVTRRSFLEFAETAEQLLAERAASSLN